jgi:hypothetical protein
VRLIGVYLVDAYLEQESLLLESTENGNCGRVLRELLQKLLEKTETYISCLVRIESILRKCIQCLTHMEIGRDVDGKIGSRINIPELIIHV